MTLWDYTYSIIVITLIFIILILPSSNARSVVLRRYLYGQLSLFIEQTHSFYRSSTIFHALGRLITDRKAPRGLPVLENYEKVSDRVYRISGLNPGSHTLQGTNTYLIGKGPDKILVDTGEDITADKYKSLLFNTVLPMTSTKSISKILLTHGHGDHQGGVRAILSECKARNLPIPIVYKCNIQNGHFPPRGFDCNEISDGDVFQVDEDTTIRAVFAPGHTDDHMAFIVKEDNALLSGDCVLGCGTTVFDDLYEYMRSLRGLREYMLPNDELLSSIGLSNPISSIYPGHGPIIKSKAVEKIDEYISHRLSREKQALECLQSIMYDDTTTLKLKSNQRGWISTWQLTSVVYGSLPLFVKISAHWNLNHHLHKLLKENRASHKYPDLWRINDQVLRDTTSASETEGKKWVCDGDVCVLK